MIKFQFKFSRSVAKRDALKRLWAKNYIFGCCTTHSCQMHESYCISFSSTIYINFFLHNGNFVCTCKCWRQVFLSHQLHEIWYLNTLVHKFPTNKKKRKNNNNNTLLNFFNYHFKDRQRVREGKLPYCISFSSTIYVNLFYTMGNLHAHVNVDDRFS